MRKNFSVSLAARGEGVSYSDETLSLRLDVAFLDGYWWVVRPDGGVEATVALDRIANFLERRGPLSLFGKRYRVRLVDRKEFDLRMVALRTARTRGSLRKP